MTLSIVSEKRLDRHGIPILVQPYEPEECPLCDGSGIIYEDAGNGDVFRELCPLWGQVRHACQDGGVH